MKSPSPRELMSECLRFFGKTTADISHDLNNVFAIVNELNGLIEDYLAAADAGRALNPDRLKNVSQRIEHQIDRGKQYVKILNRFAHTVDVPSKEFDARDLVADIISTCTRMANLKKIDISSEIPPEQVQVEANPFDLALVIHQAIEIVCSMLEPGSHLSIAMSQTDQGFDIQLSASATFRKDIDPQTDLDSLSQKIKQLGGNLELSDSEGKPLPIKLCLLKKWNLLAFCP